MIYRELVPKVLTIIQDVFPSDVDFDTQSGQLSQAYKNYRRICENIHNSDALREWKKFVHEFDGIPSYSSMPPRYVGIADLSFKEGNGMALKQQVVVELSGIHPFYTIYGLDIFSCEHPTFVSTAYSMIVSPISVYKETMEKIRNLVGIHYPNSIFLPQKLLEKTVSVNLPGAFSLKDPTIYQVLFHPDQPPFCLIKGDKKYGIER